MKRIASLLREDDGQDLTEYGLLAAFISVSAVVTLRAIGPLVDALWQVILTAIS